MEQTFGAPTYVPSVRRSKWPVIQYQSKRWENAVHEFSFKATNPKDQEIVHYRCIACYNLKKQLGREEKSPIAHLTLKNGVIITDPDNPSTPHSCTPGNVALVGKTLAQRKDLGKHTTRPSILSTSATKTTPARFGMQSSPS